MSPTVPNSPAERYLATGHFHEKLGYSIVREAGSHDWLIIYTLAGAGRVRHRDGTFRVGPHEVVLFAPQQMHAYGTDAEAARWELLWAHFVPPAAWRTWLAWPEAGPGVMRLTVSDPQVQERVTAHLSEAHRIMSGYLRHREALGLNAIEAALLWCDEQNPRGALGRLDPRVREAVDHLCRRMAEPITLESLGRACKLSPSRLARLFSEQVGVPPMRFLEQQRLDRARQLLELSGHGVAQIAEQVGFNSPFYFTLRFKRATGLSPTAYRRRFAAQ